MNQELFGDVREARVVIGDFRADYNLRLPHSSLGYLTPAEFAACSRGESSLRLASLACAPPPHATATE
ncbi:MAG: integrase core domain-containing protein [Phycisphaeraceae bacterium]|nr:integrase core domain-containing protein [Phycisphaeraceae bacterium]